MKSFKLAVILGAGLTALTLCTHRGSAAAAKYFILAAVRRVRCATPPQLQRGLHPMGRFAFAT